MPAFRQRAAIRHSAARMQACPPGIGLYFGREMSEPIYKICPEPLWRDAEAAGRFDGAAIDLTDGFIHFSTAEQVRETAARHFAGEPELLLIAVDPEALGAALRYEPSRGGALFPHLYGPLPLGPDGGHVFPADIP